MDLSTISAKLEAGMYKDRFGFESDFSLMTSNCKQYNVVGSYAHNEATALQSFFDKRELSTLIPCFIIHLASSEWSRINKTLEAAQKSQQAAAEAPARAMPPPPAPTPITKHPKTHPITPAEVPAITIRPTIKLKHNASAAKMPEAPKPAENSKSAEASKPILKAKIRKPKVVDAPPPPYVDDGSHDILQEVIAIEQEKRHRSEKDRPDRPPEKRKRASPEEDDDILATVLPLTSKKKSTSATPSAAPAEKTSTHKVAPPAPRDGASATPTVRLSLKGKEKEVAPAHASAPPPAAAAPAPAKLKKSSPSQKTPINEKKCRDVLKVILRMPEAIIFSRPVNPVMDGCPT